MFDEAKVEAGGYVPVTDPEQEYYNTVTENTPAFSRFLSLIILLRMLNQTVIKSSVLCAIRVSDVFR